MPKEVMDPTFLFHDLDPANRFAMGGLNMAFTAELHRKENLYQKCFS